MSQRVLPLSVLFLTVLATPPRASTLDSLAAHAWQFAGQQLTASVTAMGDPSRFPLSTRADGTWRIGNSSDWRSGFFPGCLWLMYQHSTGSAWRTWAASWTTGMESEKNDTSSHDVGFKIFCSFGNGWRLTGTPSWHDVIVQGAQSLSTRFNPIVGCTRSWDNRHFPVIVDNMMNLEILLWAAAHGGDPAWRDMAVSHALRTRQDHVRGDGSTYHLVDYDPTTGTILSRGTVQGYSDSSTWSRGQAWGLYGFTMTYRETGDARFLETAQRLADWFVAHLPADHVPYWDFQAPNIPDEPKDSSAAAIAASGLLELCTFATDTAARARYRSAALDILAALCSPAYLAEGTSSRGILVHGTGNKPASSEVDVSLIYGDYYFLEALLRYQALVTDAPPPLVGCRFESISPNPFNPGTQVRFALPQPGRVLLRVLDARGREMQEIANGWMSAGEHRIDWDGKRRDGCRAPSGTYFFELRASSFHQARKATLVR